MIFVIYHILDSNSYFNELNNDTTEVNKIDISFQFQVISQTIMSK